MAEPERECSLQCHWNNEGWSCALTEPDTDHYCGKNICPFWKEQKIEIEELKSIESSEEEFE